MFDPESKLEKYSEREKEFYKAWQAAQDADLRGQNDEIPGFPKPGLFPHSPSLARWFFRICLAFVAIYVAYDLIPAFPEWLFLFLAGGCLGALLLWFWRLLLSIARD
jgi:hypothetical protein